MNLFPRPIINEDNFDFSFSGLKTAVMKEVEKAKANQQFDNRTIIHLAAEVQEAIVDVLVTKTLEAVKHFKPKSLLLAGGVSANTRLRESFLKNLECKKLNVPFFVPLSNLCTDNAAYVASYAFYNFNPIPWNKILANPQLTIKD